MIGAVGAITMATTTPIVLADGQSGTSSATAGRPELAANYLASHYAGGRILADEASSAPLIYATHLGLSEFVTAGAHPYFEDAMAAPSASVKWIVWYDGDSIANSIRAHGDRFIGFTEVLHDGRAHVMQRIG